MEEKKKEGKRGRKGGGRREGGRIERERGLPEPAQQIL